MDFAAIGKGAALSQPMTAAASVPILHGRVLRLDGDGLAYYCAGNNDTLLSEARGRTREKVEGMMRACNAERLEILLTGSGSHKGYRYAVARVKPYQGQRTNSNRPRNWQGLRDMLELGDFGPAVIDYDREADDRFGQYGWADPENSVHGTQDKDMRMVPGWHIDWKDNQMFYLPPGTYDVKWKDKQYGMKWFWMQMLHGDPVDFIPGLPKAYGKLCGPVTAEKILAGATTSDEAKALVMMAYQSTYGDNFYTAMMEQAILLWMRRGPEADWFDCGAIDGPMFAFMDSPLSVHHYKAWQEMSARVQQAKELNALSPQDD